MKHLLLIAMLVAFTASLMVHKVFAATPGSPCTIRARSFLLGINIVDPGVVSNSGSSCAPLGAFTLGIIPAGVGITCGTTVQILGISLTSNCPN